MKTKNPPVVNAVECIGSNIAVPFERHNVEYQSQAPLPCNSFLRCILMCKVFRQRLTCPMKGCRSVACIRNHTQEPCRERRSTLQERSLIDPSGCSAGVSRICLTSQVQILKATKRRPEKNIFLAFKSPQGGRNAVRSRTRRQPFAERIWIWLVWQMPEAAVPGSRSLHIR